MRFLHWEVFVKVLTPWNPRLHQPHQRWQLFQVHQQHQLWQLFREHQWLEIMWMQGMGRPCQLLTESGSRRLRHSRRPQPRQLPQKGMELEMRLWMLMPLPLQKD